MGPSLRQLHHACVLAKTQSFRRASGELHLSQPALTRSIKAIEGMIGAQLFDRLSSGVVLTPVGEVFVRRAQRVLDERDYLQTSVAEFMGLHSGSLVISTGPYPGDRLVPDALGRLLAQHPDLDCRVREVDWTEVSQHLLERSADIAVADLSEVERDDRFDIEPILRDDLYFVARSGHPLAGREALQFEDFASYPLLGNRVPRRIKQYLSSRARSGQISAHAPFLGKVDIATFSATKRVVHGSDGVTLAPLIQLEDELESGTLVVLRMASSPVSLNSGIITLANRTRSPAVTQFVTMLRDVKQEMDQRTVELVQRYVGV
tara:strand:- start:9469 stop:10425 length:957 start_codon:yes stop_codon:yes gene_type:complete